MSTQREEVCFFDYLNESPSRENVELVSIAIKLWSEPEIIERVEKYFKNLSLKNVSNIVSEMDEFLQLEDRVTCKITGLNSLPPPSIIKLSNIIKPIGLQLLKCFNYRDESTYRLYNLFLMGGPIYWTSDGIIDEVKSLQDLINDGSLRKDFRYIFLLSCNYCLEELISDLWGKMSHDRKNALNNVYSNYEGHIVAYWIAKLKNELHNLVNTIKQVDLCHVYDCNSNVHLNMVLLSIYLGNAIALKYFWMKLTEKEKDDNVENFLIKSLQKVGETHWQYQHYHVSTEILCFLLSQLKNRKMVFKTHSEEILKALFFDWPRQRFFLPTINVMLKYLPKQTYVSIMYEILLEIKKRKTTEKLFAEIWCKSSIELKKAFLPIADLAIRKLLTLCDTETIYLILDVYTQEQRDQIIFSWFDSKEILKFMSTRDWRSLDSLIEYILLADEDFNGCKEILTYVFGNKLIHDWILIRNYKATNLLLCWCFDTDFVKIDSFIETRLVYGILNTLISCGNYELITEFLEWCFKSEEKIANFKKTLTHNTSRCCELLHQLSVDSEGWAMFVKFQRYFLSSYEEVLEFKQLYLEHVISFVESSRFEFATKFLFWCHGATKEAREHKNNLLLSNKGINLFMRKVICQHPNWNDIKNTIKWFLPISGDVILHFMNDLSKTIYEEDYENYFQETNCINLSHLLDEFLHESRQFQNDK